MAHRTALSSLLVSVPMPKNPAPALIRIRFRWRRRRNSWAADQGFSTSIVSKTTSPITTILVDNPAPQAVYQSERTGAFTYTVPNLTPDTTYPINLHFAEIDFGAAQRREFNVLINGVQVLTNFDIFAQAGGENVAIVQQFQATASSTGTITIQFAKGDADQPQVSGIEVLPAMAPQGALTSGLVYTVISKATGQALDDDNTTTPGGKVTQWAPGIGNTNQQWQINASGNGIFNLVSLSNGFALDNEGLKTAGSVVSQNSAATDKAGQQWVITQVGNGEYQLKNVSSGLALDTGSATGNGGSVVQSTLTNAASQMWQIVPVQIGAKTPFTSYEAEAGTLGGGAMVVTLKAPPTTEFSSPQLEASGHAYVQLTGAGQSVSWTNNTGHPVTAINVRYSIPDAAAGGGITSTLNLYVNGVFRQALNVNSKQSWIYESASSYDGQSKIPSAGMPHKFWDEMHTFLTGDAVQPGDKVTLQKDAANSAAFYYVDVVDLEAPPAPIAQPANSLSIVTCGAVANNIRVDSTTAIQNCIAEAESQGKILWIPKGTFYLNTPVNLQPTGITIEGAGMWYSTIYFNPPFPYSQHGNVLNPSSSQILNLHIDTNATNSTQDAYMLNIKGSNWLVDSVWLEHGGPGMWADGDKRNHR